MSASLDFIINTICTTLLWMLSFTLFLPVVLLLKFSKEFRDKFAWHGFEIMTSSQKLNTSLPGTVVSEQQEDSNRLKEHLEGTDRNISIEIPEIGIGGEENLKFYPKNSNSPSLNPVVSKRQQAFNRLKEHLGNRDRNIPLEILEIGIGGGSTLKYYPENSNLTALDRSEYFIKYIEESQKKYPKLTLKRTLIGMAENMNEIEDNSVDVVISTYTLCSVECVQCVLKEIKRILKPGGKFLFVEHIPYPRSSWISTLQKFAAPLTSVYSDGCSLTRKSDEEIKKTGFTDVEIDKYLSNETKKIYFNFEMIGIATK